MYINVNFRSDLYTKEEISREAAKRTGHVLRNVHTKNISVI